jgi:hypothetical protein
MVPQSDWLPMMIATGAAGIYPSNPASGRKEAADYRVAPLPGKPKRAPSTVPRLRQARPPVVADHSFVARAAPA